MKKLKKEIQTPKESESEEERERYLEGLKM